MSIQIFSDHWKSWKRYFDLNNVHLTLFLTLTSDPTGESDEDHESVQAGPSLCWSPVSGLHSPAGP